MTVMYGYFWLIFLAGFLSTNLKLIVNTMSMRKLFSPIDAVRFYLKDPHQSTSLLRACRTILMGLLKQCIGCRAKA